MSIQATVQYIKDDAIVHSHRFPVGYLSVRPDDEIIRDVLTHRQIEDDWMVKYKKGPMPEWDHFLVIVGNHTIRYDKP